MRVYLVYLQLYGRGWQGRFHLYNYVQQMFTVLANSTICACILANPTSAQVQMSRFDPALTASSAKKGTLDMARAHVCARNLAFSCPSPSHSPRSYRSPRSSRSSHRFVVIPKLPLSPVFSSPPPPSNKNH